MHALGVAVYGCDQVIKRLHLQSLANGPVCRSGCNVTRICLIQSQAFCRWLASRCFCARRLLFYLCFCLCLCGIRWTVFDNVGRRWTIRAFLGPLLPLCIAEVCAPGFLVAEIAVVLIVDDLPAPGAVRINRHQPTSIFLVGPALRVRSGQFRDGMDDHFLRHVRAPRDCVRCHVHHAVAVGQHQQVHEGVAHDVIRGDAGIEDLREDFCEHAHTLHLWSWTVLDKMPGGILR